ncbi:MAG TPA: hypothetical protein ENI07_09950 [Desulfobacterales bacterium]|nr:hypothetical protein [Desulfobacterales bacterium]
MKERRISERRALLTEKGFVDWRDGWGGADVYTSDEGETWTRDKRHWQGRSERRVSDIDTVKATSAQGRKSAN